jgi:hypothetical protein
MDGDHVVLGVALPEANNIRPGHKTKQPVEEGIEAFAFKECSVRELMNGCMFTVKTVDGTMQKNRQDGDPPGPMVNR